MGQAKRKRYTTAMHEASHVVVGLDCGRKLVRCSIVREAAFGGYGLALGTTEWEPVGNGTVDASELVKITLAGKVAEERMSGNAEQCRRYVRLDLAVIYTLAWLVTVGSEKYTPNARLIPLLTGIYCEHPHKVPPHVKRLADEMVSDLLPEVRDILERRWHDVELVAGLLLKHGRITPEMVDERKLKELQALPTRKQRQVESLVADFQSQRFATKEEVIAAAGGFTTALKDELNRPLSEDN